MKEVTMIANLKVKPIDCYYLQYFGHQKTVYFVFNKRKLEVYDPETKCYTYSILCCWNKSNDMCAD